MEIVSTGNSGGKYGEKRYPTQVNRDYVPFNKTPKHNIILIVNCKGFVYILNYI